MSMPSLRSITTAATEADSRTSASSSEEIKAASGAITRAAAARERATMPIYSAG